MNKAEITKKLAEKENITHNEAVRLFESTIEIMTNSLDQGETITLIDFGVFIPRHHKARMARNPQNGDKFLIDARKTVNFRPSKKLKETLNK